jgi:hypothetical protein
MIRRDQTGAGGVTSFLAIPFGVAIAVLLAIGVYIFVIRDGDQPTAADSGELDARPMDSATLPEGSAGDTESTGNETGSDGIVGDSGATDLRPIILDADDGPPPAATVEELEIPDRIDPSVVEPGPPGAQPQAD